MSVSVDCKVEVYPATSVFWWKKSLIFSFSSFFMLRRTISSSLHTCSLSHIIHNRITRSIFLYHLFGNNYRFMRISKNVQGGRICSTAISSRANILHNYSTIWNPGSWHCYNAQSLIRCYPVFHTCVCMCVCTVPCNQIKF